MGTSPGATTVIPPLPTGFTLDQPEQPAPAPAGGSSIPPLPAGFKLDNPSPSGGATGSWAPASEGVTGIPGVFSGIGAGIMQGAEDIKKLAEPIPGPGTVAKMLPDIPQRLRTQTSTAEQVGGGLESIGNLFSGMRR